MWNNQAAARLAHRLKYGHTLGLLPRLARALPRSPTNHDPLPLTTPPLNPPHPHPLPPAPLALRFPPRPTPLTLRSPSRPISLTPTSPLPLSHFPRSPLFVTRYRSAHLIFMAWADVTADTNRLKRILSKWFKTPKAGARGLPGALQMCKVALRHWEVVVRYMGDMEVCVCMGGVWWCVVWHC